MAKHWPYAVDSKNFNTEIFLDTFFAVGFLFLIHFMLSFGILDCQIIFGF